MRYAWEQIKRNFLLYTYRRRVNTLRSYLTKAAIVDLSAKEQDFIDFQTTCMLQRKIARQRRLDPSQDWTVSLPAMPRRGSAHAMYTVR